MSTPSSSVSRKKFQHVVAAVDSLKRQMSELQGLREEVARAEALHISERRSGDYKETKQVS